MAMAEHDRIALMAATIFAGAAIALDAARCVEKALDLDEQARVQLQAKHRRAAAQQQ